MALAALVAALVPAMTLDANASPASSSAPAAPSDGIWTATSERPQASLNGHRQRVHPTTYKAFTADAGALDAALDRAPDEARRGAQPTSLTVPAPNGELVEFEIFESPVMEDALAAKYPGIKTFAGSAKSGTPATIRLDVTPAGFHASVRGGGAAWFVDPAYQGDDSLYLSYFRSAVPKPEKGLVEPELDEETERGVAEMATDQRIGEGPGNPARQRDYRLAFLTDPTYADYFAPGSSTGAITDAASNAAVLAEKVTLVNRSNQLYGDDLGVRMTLVADTDKLNLNTTAEITGANGPCGVTACFTAAQVAGCDSPTLTRNRFVVGQLIGAANFDVGHIGFGLNGGGIASLGVVGGNNKAQGCTGLPQPTGDFYAIDYFSHEVGHQFSGNHTFNGTQLNCSGGNRNAGTSVEPGSGSSIQAYAGICQQDNIQPHSDPYFSQRSQTEMGNYINGTPANVNEVQSFAFNGAPNAFDGTDSFTLTYPAFGSSPGGTTIAFTRGTTYNAAAMIAGIAAVTGGTVAISPYFSATAGNPNDAGFTITYTGTLAGVDVPTPTLNATGFTGFGSDIAKGGPANNGGITVATPGNRNPVVTAPAGKFIPIRTPFALTGSATDPDAGDTAKLLYLWEQNDRGGTAGTALTNNTKVNGPLFRVFGKYANVPAGASPETLMYNSPGENIANNNPTRIFPDMDQILAGNTNAATGTCPAPPAPPASGGATNVPVDTIECYAEFLPTASYNGDAAAGNTEPSLNFRLTARDDNGPNGGTEFADVKLRLDKTAGPFEVTSGAAPASFDSGAMSTITWNVNNTDKPTLAPNVKITFSSDGGQTFGTVLAASTPNDGSADVAMPVVSTTTGRIKIEAVDNYFFDVNDAPITITQDFNLNESVADTVNTQFSDTPAISFTADSDFGDVTASAMGLPNGLSVAKTSGTASGVLPSTGTFTVQGNVDDALGSYPVTFTVSDGRSGEEKTFTTTIEVAAEDATAAYTGPTTAEASTGGPDAIGLTLTGTVTPAADGSPGDLTDASVTFTDTLTSEVLCTDASATSAGEASCAYSADLPSGSAGRTYSIALTVGNRYTGASTTNGALVVTVDSTAPDTSITSGPANGSLLLGTSTSFGFASSESPSTFACLLDGVAASCPTSPVGLAGLSRQTHTFSVRATDQAGNQDPTPATRTFTVPLDDADLKLTFGNWKSKASSAAYLGSYVQTKKKNATIDYTVVNAKSLSLLVGTGPKFGRVKVYLNGELLKSISLKGTSSLQQVVSIADFTSAQSGKLTIQTTNKKRVRIDGLAVETGP